MGTLDFKTEDIRKMICELLGVEVTRELSIKEKNETYELIRMLTICELFGS